MVVEQQVDGEMNLWGEEVGRWCRSFHGSWRWCLYHVREDINEKKTFSFGHCPNEGGGVYPCPNLLALFFTK